MIFKLSKTLKLKETIWTFALPLFAINNPKLEFLWVSQVPIMGRTE